MAVIYEIVNLINGKKYIGVDTKNNSKYYGSGKLIRAAIKKYGKQNFKKNILCEFENNDDAFKYERDLLNELDACNSNEYYNIHEGGYGGKTWVGETRPQSHRDAISIATQGRIPWNKGIPRSDETKEKLSKFHMGKTLSDEHKKAIGDSQRGKQRSETHCKNLSESLKGREFSDEHRQRLSESLTGRDPWNKGKTDVYSDDQLERYRNAKAGEKNPMHGKQHSAETKEKMRVAWEKRKNKQNNK